MDKGVDRLVIYCVRCGQYEVDVTGCEEIGYRRHYVRCRGCGTGYMLLAFYLGETDEYGREVPNEVERHQ